MEFFRTERLIIRRFKPGDAAALFDYFAVPRVNCFVQERLSTIEDALADVRKKARMVRSLPSVCRIMIP